MLLFTCIDSAIAADSDGLRAFLETYRCAVVERLERMHERGDRTKQTGRFLILASKQNPEYYVQCIFTDNDTAMYCEAASGFYAPASFKFRLDGEAMSALKRLGFTTDGSKGNFHRGIDGITPVDFPKIADLILRTLYEVYRVHLGTQLEWQTPLAPEINGVPSLCVPIG